MSSSIREKKKANSGTKKKKKTWKPRAHILPSFFTWVAVKPF
jgi:hypothetical protein